MAEEDKGQNSGGAKGIDPNIKNEQQSGNMVWAVNYSKKTLDKYCWWQFDKYESINKYSKKKENKKF